MSPSRPRGWIVVSSILAALCVPTPSPADDGGLVGWVTFHITGSVGGETKQISGWFDIDFNAPPMTIVQGHGNASNNFPPVVHLID
ncbi:MAG TPA: hypothetical protein VFV53_00345 [Candidatus Limnocylindrales bacterium]|nr:hypothetical protein [Candidatus Limnocylindrales bacterium]